MANESGPGGTRTRQTRPSLVEGGTMDRHYTPRERDLGMHTPYAPYLMARSVQHTARMARAEREQWEVIGKGLQDAIDRSGSTITVDGTEVPVTLDGLASAFPGLAPAAEVMRSGEVGKR